jgi:Cellulose binding domain
MGEPTRRGRSSHRPKLVRPYVLGAGGQGSRRAASAESAQGSRPAGSPAGGWTSDSTRPDLLGEAAGSAPWLPAIRPLPGARSAGHRRTRENARRGQANRTKAGSAGVSSGTLARRAWVVAFCAVVALLGVTGGVVLLASQDPARGLAGTCARTRCDRVSAGGTNAGPGPAPSSGKAGRSHHATRPSASHSATRSPTSSPRPTKTSPGPKRSGGSPSPKPSKTSPSPKPTTPTPSPSPSATATASPVDVTYTLEHTGHGGFRGAFTIVNNGSTAISGWELDAALPNDTVQWVWPAQFHMSGDTLVIDPSDDQPSIGAGDTLTVHVAAQGSTTSPTSCTFSGSPC